MLPSLKYMLINTIILFYITKIICCFDEVYRLNFTVLILELLRHLQLFDHVILVFMSPISVCPLCWFYLKMQFDCYKQCCSGKSGYSLYICVHNDLELNVFSAKWHTSNEFTLFFLSHVSRDVS